MIDFDDLDGAEDDRDEEEAPLRAAEEDEAAKAEEKSHFTARFVSPKGVPEHIDRVPLFAEPDEDAECVGERRVGDAVRLVGRSGAFARLHPLELARVATDYQDYWHAILKDEVPRLRDEAWVPLSCLSSLRPGESSDAFGAASAESAKLDPLEKPWLARESRSVVDEGALELVSQSLTLVVSTSPADRHCDAGLMLQVLRSLQANKALHGCRKLVVFDALPLDQDQQAAEDEGAVAKTGERWVPKGNERLAQAYDRYKKTLEAAVERSDPAMHRVELIFMPRWGHLVGTVRYALERITTPYVMLHQHDLLLSRNTTPSHVAGILGKLASREANYVILNRDVNFVGRSTQYFQAAPHRPDLWRVFSRGNALSLDDQEQTPLTPFIGFSDQTHFARASWVRDRVLRMVGERKCCMEFALHELMILAWLRDPGRWERTYMLGGMDDGPFIYDSQKNGHCWALAADAYSEEKVEEMMIPSAERIPHPRREGHFLALYVFTPGEDGRPSRTDHYPDTDSSRNLLSRELFDLRGRMQSRSQKGSVFVHRWAPD